MSGVSLPVTRPTGRALVVANAVLREQPVAALQALGFDCTQTEDPYAAMAELSASPLVYKALVLSLAGLYVEELEIIQVVKRRFANIDIWLTQTDGRQATLAQAMRLGADGLLSDDGMHRIALTGHTIERPSALDDISETRRPEPSPSMAPTEQKPKPQELQLDHHSQMGEPVLSAEELHALLDDNPS